VRCPYVQTNIRWPLPVDQRLNEMVSLLSRVGVHVTRSQLAAALVAHAPAALAELKDVVAKYTAQTVGSVVLQRRGDVVPAERRPGRRSNS
jgi:hypothetical protein